MIPINGFLQKTYPFYFRRAAVSHFMEQLKTASADADAVVVLTKARHQLKSLRNAEHFFYFIQIHLLKADRADVGYVPSDTVGNVNVFVFNGAVADPTATVHSLACLRASHPMDQGIAAFLTQFDITSFVHNVDSCSKNLGPRPMNGFRVYVRYEWYRNRGQNNGDAGSGRAKNTCARAPIMANLRCCVKGIERKEQKIFS
jgi:hypothetical protein